MNNESEKRHRFETWRYGEQVVQAANDMPEWKEEIKARWKKLREDQDAWEKQTVRELLPDLEMWAVRVSQALGMGILSPMARETLRLSMIGAEMDDRHDAGEMEDAAWEYQTWCIAANWPVMRDAQWPKPHELPDIDLNM